jgi:ComF family protein
MLSLLLDLAGALLAPERCAACDAPVRRLRAFCAACAATALPPPPSPLPWPTVAVGAYGGALAGAIHRLKYEGRRDLARPLGELLAAAAAAVVADLVIPVPLAPGRLVDRGYNQAGLLAARVAARQGGRFAPVALRRRVETGAQARRGLVERGVALAGAFEAAGSLVGARVLLVDDVLTTGATLREAAAAVEQAGARVAAVAAVAVVERWSPQH